MLAAPFNVGFRMLDAEKQDVFNERD